MRPAVNHTWGSDKGTLLVSCKLRATKEVISSFVINKRNSSPVLASCISRLKFSLNRSAASCETEIWPPGGEGISPGLPEPQARLVRMINRPIAERVVRRFWATELSFEHP